jgi:hypothetical protein
LRALDFESSASAIPPLRQEVTFLPAGRDSFKASRGDCPGSLRQGSEEFLADERIWRILRELFPIADIYRYQKGTMHSVSMLADTENTMPKPRFIDSPSTGGLPRILFALEANDNCEFAPSDDYLRL